MAIADMLQKRASQSLSMNELNQDKWSRQMPWQMGVTIFFWWLGKGTLPFRDHVCRWCDVIICVPRSWCNWQVHWACVNHFTTYTVRCTLQPLAVNVGTGCWVQEDLETAVEEAPSEPRLHFGLPLVNSMRQANVWCRAGIFQYGHPVKQWTRKENVLMANAWHDLFAKSNVVWMKHFLFLLRARVHVDLQPEIMRRCTRFIHDVFWYIYIHIFCFQHVTIHVHTFTYICSQGMLQRK